MQYNPTTIDLPDAMLGCAAQPIADDPIQRGQEAWRRLTEQHTRADWFTLGEALAIGQSQAMKEAATNRPIGRKYTRIYGAWLAAHKFHDINKSTRCRLLQCVEHRANIEAWIATLPSAEALKLNHPDVILRRWKAAAQSQSKNANTFTKRELSAAWRAASLEERRQHLDQVGLASLLHAISAPMRDEITHRVLGNCDRPSSADWKLTKVLRKGLSTKIPGEQVAALGTINRSLAARELDLHDVSITITTKKAKAN
jgi:hypothetical protein